MIFSDKSTITVNQRQLRYLTYLFVINRQLFHAQLNKLSILIMREPHIPDDDWTKACRHPNDDDLSSPIKN